MNRQDQIRELNDRLRRDHNGGIILMSRGIQELGAETILLIDAAVTRFDDFTADNDPHGEHDFGTIQVGDLSVMFKIDYYARDLKSASPDPADSNVTERVMTIMLAEDY